MRRGFSMLELLVVVGIIGLFAGLVIPSLASASRPVGGSIENLLEIDLRRARTEALMRGEPIALVAADDGRSWWLAPSRSAGTPIDGTVRAFGRGGLAPMKGTTLIAKGDEDSAAWRVIASFDSLGSRDEGVPSLELRDSSGKRVAAWTIPAGRTRLAAAH